MLNIKKSKLKSGTRLMVVPMQSTEAVTVIVLFRAGSRYETKDINGIAHFLEHMFFKGGERYPDPQAVAVAIDGIGGIFNAFTGNEFVGYWVKVAKEHIERAFDVLSDMLLNSKLDAAAMDRERGVILEEYKMIPDAPKRLIDYEFEQLMFGDHPLGWSTIGLPQVVRSLKRDDFIRYKDQLYTAANMVVAVAGNTTLGQVRKLTYQYLAYPRSSRKNQPIPYRRAPPNLPVRVVNRKTKQAHLNIGVPTFGAQHRDRYIAQVLATVLGGGMSSRLFMSVREKHGLAYYVYAFTDFFDEIGYLGAKAGVDKERID